MAAFYFAQLSSIAYAIYKSVDGDATDMQQAHKARVCMMRVLWDHLYIMYNAIPLCSVACKVA